MSSTQPDAPSGNPATAGTNPPSPDARRHNRLALLIGSALGFMTVALGAFGAHALRARLTDPALAWWQTAVDYQGLHALVLLVVAALPRTNAARRLDAAVWVFLAGVLLFSGSLYVMALTGWRWLGMMTPVGGLCLLAGWLLLLSVAWARRH